MSNGWWWNGMRLCATFSSRHGYHLRGFLVFRRGTLVINIGRYDGFYTYDINFLRQYSPPAWPQEAYRSVRVASTRDPVIRQVGKGCALSRTGAGGYPVLAGGGEDTPVLDERVPWTGLGAPLPLWTDERTDRCKNITFLHPSECGR